MLHFLDCLGLIIFALTGVVKSREQSRHGRRGVVYSVFYAMLTALGGGTLRDICLGQFPVFWMRNPISLWLTLGAAIVTLMYLHHSSLNLDALWVLDALGLAAFTVIGTQVGLAAQIPCGLSAGLGLLTGVGGGLVRDLMGAMRPLLWQDKTYGVASFIGGLFYALASLEWQGPLLEMAAVSLIVAIRWMSRIVKNPQGRGARHSRDRRTADRLAVNRRPVIRPVRGNPAGLDQSLYLVAKQRDHAESERAIH